MQQQKHNSKLSQTKVPIPIIVTISQIWYTNPNYINNFLPNEQVFASLKGHKNREIIAKQQTRTNLKRNDVKGRCYGDRRQTGDLAANRRPCRQQEILPPGLWERRWARRSRVIFNELRKKGFVYLYQKCFHRQQENTKCEVCEYGESQGGREITCMFAFECWT